MAALISRVPARDREATAFIALEGVEGLGPRKIRFLWETHGSASAALETLEKRPDLAAATRVTREIRRRGLRCIPLGDPSYPERLYDLSDPPPVLFVQGKGWPTLDPAVAIVGTRRASPYGRRIASRLARDLARWGWTVVSGMAAGIDAAAHEGALDGEGHTIGVLGTGHGHEFPPSNRRLYDRMRTDGWLLSEFRPSVGPSKHSFPRRNRIIAALSKAVIVVEAGEGSGALITANLGTQLGREIMAVPARVGDRGGVGPLRLLRDGAALITRVHDIFDALGWVHADPTPARRARVGGGPDGWVLECLGSDQLTANELAQARGRDVAGTVAALGRLEIDGKIGKSPDGRFHALDTAETGVGS